MITRSSGVKVKRVFYLMSGAVYIYDSDCSLAEIRLYDGDNWQRTILAQDVRGIKADKVQPVTLDEGVKAMLQQYDTNVSVDHRDYYVWNLFRQVNNKMAEDFRRGVQTLDARDIKLY